MRRRGISREKLPESVARFDIARMPHVNILTNRHDLNSHAMHGAPQHDSIHSSTQYMHERAANQDGELGFLHHDKLVSIQCPRLKKLASARLRKCFPSVDFILLISRG